MDGKGMVECPREFCALAEKRSSPVTLSGTCSRSDAIDLENKAVGALEQLEVVFTNAR